MLYSISEKVIHGKGLGHKHGMPTINQEYNGNIKPGVYGGLAIINNEKKYCVTNVGTRPSIDDSSAMTIETYIIDYNGNLYDQIVEVDLYFYLRDIIKFDGGIEDVKKQIEKDISKTIKLFNKTNKID